MSMTGISSVAASAGPRGSNVCEMTKRLPEPALRGIQFSLQKRRRNVMARHVVCKVSELSVGEMKRFKAGETSVLVYHLEDGFHATQTNCTHTFGPLGRGKIIDGYRVRCPLHHAEFDIRTGEVHKWANFPPGIQLLNVVRSEKALKTYPAMVENGNVVVEV
jgi:3-phenylpropionate/trans-cinnamate dioxygenase ferredoxin subunit